LCGGGWAGILARARSKGFSRMRRLSAKSDVKVAVLGAGSFVFGPSVLKDAIAEHRLSGLELALMDPNGPVVELMAAVGRRMGGDLGVKVSVTAHTERARALEGADFVICSAARELKRRFEMDCEIVERLSPGHLVTEFGGIAGISYSLRQIALIQEICGDMRRMCPKAWLLEAANPLPRVSQAAHEEGVRTAGFCSVSLSAYGRIWHILHAQRIGYPFEPARSVLEVTMAGLNHFSWVVDVRDAASGADLYPELRNMAPQYAPAGEPATFRLFHETGYLPAPGDDHIRDFIASRGEIPGRSWRRHGSVEEREARMELLRKVAEGQAPWQMLTEHESWEKPMDLVAAMAYDKPARFHALNLINCGQIEALGGGVFVETPAVGTSVGPLPERVELPASVAGACELTATVTDTIVRAARRRSRRLVHRAVELDPTILDKGAGMAAIDACMGAHADVLPAYE